MKVKLENKTKIYKEFTCSLMNILITFLRGKKVMTLIIYNRVPFKNK